MPDDQKTLDVPDAAASQATLDKLTESGIRFSSSGLFFIIFGCVLLYLSYKAQLNDDVHSSFAFVLVVLAVAVILFGTGTQGVGTIQNGSRSDGNGFVRASLAGGAGVIALMLGWGIVKNQKEIRQTFAKSEQLYKVVVKFSDLIDGPILSSNYLIEASWANEQRPVLFQNGNFIIMVPKLPKDSKTMNLSLNIYRKDLNKDFKSKLNYNLDILSVDFEEGKTKLEYGHGFKLLTSSKTVETLFKTESARRKAQYVSDKLSDEKFSVEEIDTGNERFAAEIYLRNIVTPSEPNGGLNDVFK